MLAQCRYAAFSYTVQFDFLLNGEAEASVSAFLCSERELDEYKKVLGYHDIYSLVLCGGAPFALVYVHEYDME